MLCCVTIFFAYKGRRTYTRTDLYNFRSVRPKTLFLFFVTLYIIYFIDAIYIYTRWVIHIYIYIYIYRAWRKYTLNDSQMTCTHYCSPSTKCFTVFPSFFFSLVFTTLLIIIKSVQKEKTVASSTFNEIYKFIGNDPLFCLQ